MIAASDYVTAVPDQLARWIPGMRSLGTDGFGRSDTHQNLRRHFEVDAEFITLAALKALADRRLIDPAEVARAIDELGIAPDKPDPATA